MKVGGKKAISCSFLDPPEKPSPFFFLTTPQKKENPFLCGLHEVYSHIMLRPNLYIYLSTRVDGLSRGLVSAILVAKAL